MQGFGPAIGLRELLLKRTILKRGWFTSVIIVSMCLAFSAFYEMIEWWSALIMGEGAEDFLGTQGDIWDTQWDMFLALVGASIAVVLVARWQDRQIAKSPALPS
jgi:putative membrane protein